MSSSLTNILTVGKELFKGILEVVLFTIFSFNWSVKKNCVAKTLQAIWETFLYENSCNFNSYKLSYKLAFIHFLILSYKPKTRTNYLESCWPEK